MAERQLRIGLDVRFSSGPMTGIGNYSFHLLQALIEHYSDLRFIGFERMRWVHFGADQLQAIARSHAKDPNAAAIPQTRNRFRHELGRFGLMRAARRWAYRSAFARSVAAQRLDLFHALNFLPPSDPRVPTLPVIYDLSFVRHPQAHPIERVRWLDQLAAELPRYPLVQTISEFSRREITEVYGIRPDRVFVAPPAAAQIFRPLGKQRTATDLNAFRLRFGGYLLAVGTLEPRKNLRTLVSAYSALRPRERTAPLVVVGGGGWGELRLPPEARAMQREGTLRYLGAVPDRHLRSLYEGAIALLFPSIYEGFGMPVVEAMSCGTPVVHSHGTSVDEITMGLAKCLSPLDVDAWSEALREILARGYIFDEGLRTSLRRQALEFSWTKSAEKVHGAYRQLLAQTTERTDQLN